MPSSRLWWSQCMGISKRTLSNGAHWASFVPVGCLIEVHRSKPVIDKKILTLILSHKKRGKKQKIIQDYLYQKMCANISYVSAGNSYQENGSSCKIILTSMSQCKYFNNYKYILTLFWSMTSTIATSFPLWMPSLT